LPYPGERGARQLKLPPARGDAIILDFDKAMNLPCPYSSYKTCPLAPPQNHLSLAITAGELKHEPVAKNDAREPRAK
jgi:uncharacterized protein (DUF1684 family)